MCEIFAQHIPLCEFSFVTNFQKHALGPFPKSQCEFHRNVNLMRIRFCANFLNHALCLGEPQECEIFAQHIVLCEIRTSSLKAMFSSLNSKLLLHFSQHLSFDHPIQALHLPNQSLKLRIQATFSSKETHFRRVEELQISNSLREKAPISKPNHHEKSFSYLSQHFPPSKAKNFHHLNELQNFKWACE